MKIFLAGQKSFGLAAYLLLEKRGDRIVGVSAPATDEKGRPDKLFAYAQAYRVPVICDKALRAENIPPDTDLIVCAHSHAFVGRLTRRASRLGAIGYHPSLLPRHRGRDAIRWTLRMNDPVTGGTVFWLDDNVDGGPIAAQEWVWVKKDDTASSIWRDTLFPLGIGLLNNVLDDIEKNIIVRIPQDESAATWEPSLNPPRLFRQELVQLADGADGRIYRTETDRQKLIDTFR